MVMNADISVQSPRCRRRWFQFSLGTLLLLFAVASIGVGWWRMRRETRIRNINEWISQLVSPNPAPKTLYGNGVEGVADVYPAEYDQAAQNVVSNARNRLHNAGYEALPYLMQHLDDRRYSFTADAGECDVNWSVRTACRDLIRCFLEPYGNFGSERDLALRPSYFLHCKLFEPKAAAEWWRTHKDKSLHDLQLESVQWVITEEVKTPGRFRIEDGQLLQSELAELQSSSAPLRSAEFPIAK